MEEAIRNMYKAAEELQEAVASNGGKVTWDVEYPNDRAFAYQKVGTITNTKAMELAESLGMDASKVRSFTVQADLPESTVYASVLIDQAGSES